MIMQNKVNGILGLWIIALAFLGFSVSFQRMLLVVTGIVIMLISFWGKSLVKSAKDLNISRPEEKPKEEPKTLNTGQ